MAGQARVLGGFGGRTGRRGLVVLTVPFVVGPAVVGPTLRPSAHPPPHECRK